MLPLLEVKVEDIYDSTGKYEEDVANNRMNIIFTVIKLLLCAYIARKFINMCKIVGIFKLIHARKELFHTRFASKDEIPSTTDVHDGTYHNGETHQFRPHLNC